MANYNKLEVYKSSYLLVLKIYKITARFPSEEKYSLVSQIRRSSYSIPSNIAEGSQSGSDKSFKRYLRIALSSSNELKYFIMLSKDLGYTNKNEYTSINKKITIISKKLTAFIRVLHK